MSKSTQITDYFSSSKKLNESNGRKRKLVTRESTIDPKLADNIWSGSEQVTSESDNGYTTRKRSKIVVPKSRAQILVEMATSPKKGATANGDDSCSETASPTVSKNTNIEVVSPPRRPVLTSPVKDNLLQSPMITSPMKSVKRSLFSSLPIKTLLSQLPPKSPVKTESRAYETFRHLIGKGLVLPQKYRIIVETMKDIDDILVVILNGRKSPTFDELKVGVERKSGRRFDHDKLAQIKSVYENSYLVTYERTIVKAKDGSNKLSLSMVVHPAKMLDGKLIRTKLNCSDITRRKNELIDILTDITKKHHIKFLRSECDPPILLDDYNSITAWHRKFDIETVPHIEIKPYALPPPPVKANTGNLTVADYFKKNLKNAPSFQASQQLIQKAEEPTTNTSDVEQSSQSSGKSSIIKVGKFKGISSDLLQKVRAKESAQAAIDMLRSPENEKKIAMIKSMPRYINILRNYFVQEKRGVIEFEKVISKIILSNHSSVGVDEVTDHLKYLAQLLPSWITIFTARKGEFVRLANIDMKMVDIEIILDRYKKRLDNDTLEKAKMRSL